MHGCPLCQKIRIDRSVADGKFLDGPGYYGIFVIIQKIKFITFIFRGWNCDFLFSLQKKVNFNNMLLNFNK